jgi:tRNA(Ile)-lysidine synthase
VQHLGAAQDVGYIHVTAAVAIALNGQVGSVAQLKGGVHLRIGYGMIFVEYESEPMVGDYPLLSEGAELPLTIPGDNRISEDWLLHASLNPLPEAAPVLIPEGSTVLLRGRRTGDRFAPQGLNGSSKKLNAWLIDRKVPRHLRDHLPLLVVDDGIAAVWWQNWHLAFNSSEALQSTRVVYITLNRA